MVKAERWEHDMIDTMWSFMQMGGLKSNYPALKEACMEMRQMMMQKTAGQRKDRPQDLSWDNLERVKATIIVEAMALVLSGDFESQAHSTSDEEALDGKVAAAKKNAAELKDFCFEWDCTVCPFVRETGKKCALNAPCNWNLKENQR